MTISNRIADLISDDQPQRHRSCALTRSAARPCDAGRAAQRVERRLGMPSTSTTAPAGTFSSSTTVSPSSRTPPGPATSITSPRTERPASARPSADASSRAAGVRSSAELRVVRQRAAAAEDRRLDDHAQRVALDHRARSASAVGHRPIGGGFARRARGCAARSHRAPAARRRALRPARPACRRRPTLRPARARRPRPAARRRPDSVVVPVFSNALHAGSTSVASSAVSVMNSSLTTTNGVASSASSASLRGRASAAPGSRPAARAPTASRRARLRASPAVPSRIAAREHPDRLGAARVGLFAEDERLQPCCRPAALSAHASTAAPSVDGDAVPDERDARRAFAGIAVDGVGERRRAHAAQHAGGGA